MTHSPTMIKSNAMKKQLLVTAIALGSIIGAIAIANSGSDDFSQQNLAEKAPQYPKVSIETVRPASYQAEVTAFGSATPRYNLSLSNEVSGRINYLSDQLQTGMTVKKGELLITLDDRLYQQAVANAETQVSDAHVALLQEELNVKQAQQEWQRSGLEGQPDSELVLRQPQLKAAENKFNYAQHTLNQAKADLQKTKIHAPFDALVISRQAQPAAYLQTGTQVSELISTDVVDISLSLSDAQWAQLPPLEQMIKQQWPVQLSANNQSTSNSPDNNTTTEWRGFVTRGEQHLNDNSRQRSLIVSVKNPLSLNPPLFPGTFLQAHLSGQNLHNLWQLPASAITQNNQLWYLNDDNALTPVDAQVRFSIGNQIYVEPVSAASLQGDARILSHPLSSYLAGMKVQPKSAQLKSLASDSAAASNIAETE